MLHARPPRPQRRIAVIGGGISGMGAAHLLADRHEVTLFEAEPRLGGHARTVMTGPDRAEPVDMGFIVFNYANYPYLSALFHKLAVPVAPSNMTFAASIAGGWLEYGLHDLDRVLAQRQNMLRPGFLRMVRDVAKFNTRAEELATDPKMTIRELLEALGTGPWFRDYYLQPFSGAIWSMPVDKILDFPAQAMVRFFKNHALMSHKGQHQWYTVEGGSIQYVRRLEAELRRQGVTLRLGTPVGAVHRTGVGVEIATAAEAPETFDEVIFACHSDQALRLLADADAEEARLLGAVGYQPNQVVLHTDARMMPQRRKVWASWNYTEAKGQSRERIDLTYWMNSLQPLKGQDVFVTLNSNRPIREDLIIDEVTFHHPVYTVEALSAQGAIAVRNGKRNTWFCGAWMKNGFHEDGLASAVDVVESLDAQPVLAIAAQ